MIVWADSHPAWFPGAQTREGKAWFITAITSVVLLLMAGLLAPRAVATTPGTNGRLTFMRQDHNGLWQVWTSNPDLTAEHQLTSGHLNSGWSSGRPMRPGSHSIATGRTPTSRTTPSSTTSTR